MIGSYREKETNLPSIGVHFSGFRRDYFSKGFGFVSASVPSGLVCDPDAAACDSICIPLPLKVSLQFMMLLPGTLLLKTRNPDQFPDLISFMMVQSRSFTLYILI